MSFFILPTTSIISIVIHTASKTIVICHIFFTNKKIRIVSSIDIIKIVLSLYTLISWHPIVCLYHPLVTEK